MSYYKVVSEDLKSAYVHRVGSHTNKYCIQYKIGEFVGPKVEDTYLMVFDNLCQARYFARSEVCLSNEMKIFSCEVIDPIEPLFGNCSNFGKFDTIWNLFRSKKLVEINYNTLPFSNGTVWAKSVKLIDELETIGVVRC